MQSRVQRVDDLVDEQILWLEITMQNVVTVTKLKTSQQLVHERLQTDTHHMLIVIQYCRVPTVNKILCGG